MKFVPDETEPQPQDVPYFDELRAPEELHGSWMQSYITMGWVYGEEYDREKKIHPDLVPYADLGQLERDKDSVFVALCEIARLFIYELDEDG